MRGGLFALTGAVFTADQILKRKVEEDLSQGQVGRIGPRFIITRSRNRGAAMNLGEKNPELITAASGLVLTAAQAALVSRLLKGRRGLTETGLALLTGGGASNVADRLRQGYVTDYIRFRTGNPETDKVVYNLGDLAIFAGAAFLVAGIFRGEV